MSLRNYYKDRSVKILLEQLAEDEYDLENNDVKMPNKQKDVIYIKTTDEYKKLLKNYPDGAPRVVIGK